MGVAPAEIPTEGYERGPESEFPASLTIRSLVSRVDLQKVPKLQQSDFCTGQGRCVKFGKSSRRPGFSRYENRFRFAQDPKFSVYFFARGSCDRRLPVALCSSGITATVRSTNVSLTVQVSVDRGELAWNRCQFPGNDPSFFEELANSSFCCVESGIAL